jgi:hypothetical protein
MLNNEASKGENKSNITTFIVLFIVVSLSAMFCAYLNYTFSAELTKRVFMMFAGGFFGDLLVTRPLFLFILALGRYFTACCQGYRKVQY